MVVVYPRQAADPDDPLAAPEVEGVSGVRTADTSTETATGLAVDPDAPVDTDSYTVPLVATQIGDTPNINIPSPTPSSSSSSPAKPTSSGADTEGNAVSSGSDSSDDGLSLGTTIGICVGALVGAALAVLFGLWLYKRSSPKARKRRAMSQSWRKIDEDGGDRWQSAPRIGDQPNMDGDGEKLSMPFKKSNSQRTAYTSKTDYSSRSGFGMSMEDPPFAQYHPHLAQEMASTETVNTATPLANPPPTSSWASPQATDSPAASFLSLRPSYVEGSVSNKSEVAMRTPTAVTSEAAHRWHSAEVVVDYGDGYTAEPQSANPFMHESEVDHGGENPFFNAQGPSRSLVRRVSKADPVLGEDHHASIVITNPFSDDNVASKPSHMTATSMNSTTSNGRAIQSLIAALQVSPEQAEERLRIASMQPSIISEMSEYSNVNEDVSQSFPLPPLADERGSR